MGPQELGDLSRDWGDLRNPMILAYRVAVIRLPNSEILGSRERVAGKPRRDRGDPLFALGRSIRSTRHKDLVFIPPILLLGTGNTDSSRIETAVRAHPCRFPQR
jgi:hypothetical protein